MEGAFLVVLIDAIVNCSAIFPLSNIVSRKSRNEE